MWSDEIIDGGRVGVAAEAAIDLGVGRGAEAQLGDGAVGVVSSAVMFFLVNFWSLQEGRSVMPS